MHPREWGYTTVIVNNAVSQPRASDGLVLLLAERDDPLARAIVEQVRARGWRHEIVDEEAMFRMPFAWHGGRGRPTGWLSLADDRRVPLDTIRSVMVRLRRRWWPSTELHLQDQVFVYHESTAAWSNLLTHLPCAVINRFPLGWWLQDQAFHQRMQRTFGDLLRLDRDNTPWGRRIYVVGDQVIAHGSRGSTIDLLNRSPSALSAWQAETGIRFLSVRLAEDPASTPRFEIDLCPAMAGEPADVVRAVAEATTRQLL